jgi:predicted lipoprotein with Yx(FWY)xxD motif
MGGESHYAPPFRRRKAEVITPMKRFLLLAIAPVAVAVVVAGCGGSSYGGGSSSNTQSGASSTGPAVAVKKLPDGNALVDAQGRALYLFEADKGTTSNCSAGCASVWPPATTSGKPTAGSGISAAKLGTTKRSDGTTELTYNGHPLYRYVADTKPGEAKGQGLNQFGAKWYLLGATGNKIDND